MQESGSVAHVENLVEGSDLDKAGFGRDAHSFVIHSLDPHDRLRVALGIDDLVAVLEVLCLDG